MLQDTLNNVSAAREKLQSRVQPQVDQASAELKKVLSDLGVEVTGETRLQELVTQLRERNPSLRSFTRNLDVATYDLRKKLWWNANMMSAYVADQAGQRYEAEVKPKLQHYRQTAESRARTLFEQIRELAPASQRAESE
ncbi:hypothetical protein C8D92_107184 [Tamilnaduibacter salinus]|uniref:Uncharacterized protein n=1 Tax=Tamilnaduibacter salinus TaxID=1484056 RepID=A0A2A2I8H5_9GAMM|nr:hypothetical protein [Tamilnaduibacter salinus]PAV27430.1 hypothetical protein CF392_00505 [Tamilnaduibacter salinus]PVY75461.1 hypothetical protein C8D92_107184 [Tamilnaduibacter salinus]